MMHAYALDIAVIERDPGRARLAVKMFSRVKIEVKFAEKFVPSEARPDGVAAFELERLVRGGTGDRVFGSDDKERRRFLDPRAVAEPIRPRHHA